jgi:Cdc6-like AAA superfamily ATPase
VLAQMFADLRCSPSCTHAGVHGTVSICPPDCFQYKGTLDVFYKIIRQVGDLLVICDNIELKIILGVKQQKRTDRTASSMIGQ